MKIFTYILAILISCQISIGQEKNNGLIGRFLVNDDFEFIELINDSLIFSSLISSNDTSKYEISDNTLIVKERIYDSRSLQKFEFLINKKSDSTLNIRFDKYFNSEFHDIKSISNNIFDFRHIELDYLTPWDDDRIIQIDSLGNYYERIIFCPLKKRPFKRKSKTIKKRLSSKELHLLKQNLSKFYAIYLPKERGCPIDGDWSNFLIVTNGKIIESKGCYLSWTHTKLLEYILNLK
jgi:hypothetical protein